MNADQRPDAEQVDLTMIEDPHWRLVVETYNRANGGHALKLRAVAALLAPLRISTEHGPWVESNIHDGETYCARCLVQSVFALHRKCDPHIVGQL